MSKKGDNTTTTNTGPNPAAAGAYNQLLDRAQGVASTPYQAYGGDLVAPVNAQQTSGINNINQSAGFAQPYIQQATGYANNAAQPLTAQQIQQYQNPYTQNVVDATQGQFNLMNEQALNNIQGNAASQGALGGDRVGVAKSAYYGATLPGQEQQIAGLYNQGYSQAVQTAQQQQQNQAMAAYSLGNLGVSGQNAALTGANAQIGAGTLEQQTQQAQLGANYGQFQLQQAFPYQQTQWLAGLDTGVGSQMGGTSSTTGPAPNPLSTIAGLGLTAAGAYFGGPAGASAGAAAGKALTSARGGRIAGFDDGGAVMPYAGAHGWIPGVGIVRGHGAPPPPNTGSGPSGPSAGASNAAAGVGSYFANRNMGISTDPAGSGLPYADSPDAGGFGPSGYARVPFADPGIGFASPGARYGGRIAGFADGGGTDVPLPVADPRTPGFVLDRIHDYAAQTGRQPENFTGSDITRLQRQIGVTGGRPERPSRYADGGAPSFDDRWAGFGPAVPLPVARPNGDVDNPDSAYNRGLLPRPNVGYTGGDIDASDINLNGGSGGVGLGAPYEGSNAALLADAGGASGRVPTAGVAGPARAPLAYGPGYDRQPAPANPAPSAAPQGGFFDNLPGRGSLSPAVSQGMMAAGLGMMASHSPFLGVALGEGGLRGLGEYTGEKQREFAQEQQTQQKALEGRKVELESQKLGQAAEHWQKQLALETEKYQVPPGYQRSKDGSLAPTPGGPADPAAIRAAAVAKRVPGMDDDALHTMVQSYRGGNTSVLQGISRGVSGPDNLNRFWNILSADLKNEGASGTDLNAAKANFTAQSAAAKTAAQREATISTAVNEAKGTFPLVLQRSLELPRTDYVPFNKLLQMVREGTSSPEQGRLAVALQGAITAYSQAMSRTGANSVFAQQHAETLLSGVTSHEALSARIGQMQQEMEIAEQAPEQTRQQIMDRILGRSSRSGDGATPAPGGARPTPTPSDVAYVKAHPEVRDKFVARFGVEP